MTPWPWILVTIAIPVVVLGGQRVKWWIEDRRWDAYVERWYQRQIKRPPSSDNRRVRRARREFKAGGGLE